MTTYTAIASTVPATRGRPFWFDLDITLAGSGGAAVSLENSVVTAVLAWGSHCEPARATVVGGKPRLYWTAAQTRNLPVSPVPVAVVTVVDSSGEYHDIVVGVTTKVIPMLSAPGSAV